MNVPTVTWPTLWLADSEIELDGGATFRMPLTDWPEDQLVYVEFVDWETGTMFLERNVSDDGG